MARTHADAPLQAARQEEEESSDEENNAPDKIRLQAQRPIFRTNDGDMIRFLLHKSVRGDRRDYLEKQIVDNGGIVVELEALYDVDTIIVDPNSNSVDMERMRLQFGCSRDPRLRKIHVEGLHFIAKCVGRGKVVHVVPVIQGLGGPLPKQAKHRMNFTPEDDENLCQYIASRRPDKASGGRSGNSLYKDLVNLAPMNEDDPDEYEWVTRHSWHSWRERYVRRQEKMDPKIDQFVDIYPPVGQAMDHRDRRHGRLGRRLYKSAAHDSDSQGEFEEGLDGGEEDDHEDPASPKRARHARDRSSHRSAKRQRRANDDQDADQQNVPNANGKAREMPDPEPLIDENAIPFDDVSNSSGVNADINMFPGDEPGPSYTQRTPEPEPTQTTLVGTAPSGSLKPTQASRVDVTREVEETTGAESTINAVQEEEPSHPHSTRGRGRAPRVIATLQPSGRVVTKPPSKRAPRSAPIVPVEGGAPYRNTRSRSRLAQQEATAHARARRPLPVVEDLPDEEVVEDDRSHTVGEEKDVADVAAQLTANDQSIVITTTNGGGEGRLDSDDEQTDQVVRGTPHPFDDGESSSDSEAVLETMRRARSLQKGPAKVSTEPFRPTGLPISKPGARSLVTPHGRPRQRQAESSGESQGFPSPGTRAFMVRNALEEEEKRTPYQPPRGTRAAAVRK